MGLDIRLNTVRSYTYNRNETKIVIPEGVKGIGNGVFQYWSHITDIIFPESLTGIGVGAFCGCTGIRNLNLPYGIKKLNYCTFAGMQLKNITIPDSVNHIDSAAFGWRTYPENITIKGINTQIRIADVNLNNCKYGIHKFISGDLAEKEDMIINKRFINYINTCFAVFIALEYDSKAGWKYIEENKKQALQCLIDNENDNAVIMILEKFSFSADEVDELIQYANDNKKYEIQIILSQYRHNNFGSALDLFDKYFI